MACAHEVGREPNVKLIYKALTAAAVPAPRLIWVRSAPPNGASLASPPYLAPQSLLGDLNTGR